jgi:hypothetical protein
MSKHLFHWDDLQNVGSNDTLICDVPVIEWAYDALDRHVSLDPTPCGTEVYVRWSFMVPIIKGEPTFPENVGKEAVSSGWEMVCENGHVHALSSNQHTADDSAEQFDPTVVHAAEAGEKGRSENE